MYETISEHPTLQTIRVESCCYLGLFRHVNIIRDTIHVAGKGFLLRIEPSLLPSSYGRCSKCTFRLTHRYYSNTNLLLEPPVGQHMRDGTNLFHICHCSTVPLAHLYLYLK